MAQDSKTAVDRWATFNLFFDRVTEGKEIRPLDGYVWLAIFRHGTTNGRSTVTNAEIRRATRIKDKRTLNDSLKRLQECGILKLVQKGGSFTNGKRQATVWGYSSCRKNLPK